jgi:glycosyltransferase involved in cell wall biosynthesis
MVVCYENAALHTFRIAKEFGAKTILDAASFHYSWQDRFFEHRESTAAHQRITRHKDEELQLADHILTVSKLAMESYVQATGDERRVTCLPIGVDTEVFKPHLDRPRNAQPTRFVFVGRANRLKGCDCLVDALHTLERRNGALQLTVVGERDADICWPVMPGCRHVSRLPHRRLADELTRHDVLILPSRFDSFGMVVAEAMACGLPVIVTENVGAKEMITPYENGIIVPTNDPAALAQAMEWFIDHNDRRPEMAMSARLAAEKYDWANYRRRAVQFFGQLQEADE